MTDASVPVAMSLLRLRWPSVSRPQPIVTALIALHVMTLRYYGSPPPVRALRAKFAGPKP